MAIFAERGKMKKVSTRFLTLILVLAVAALCALPLTACNKKAEPTATLHYSNNTYTVGDDMDTDMYVEVNDNGSVSTAAVTDDMVTGFSTEDIAGMAEATVTYDGHTMTYYYFVANPLAEFTATDETVYLGLPYGTAESNTFDMYLPCAYEALTGDEPVFLYIHGGGWMGGDSSENSETVYPALLSKGFVVLSMNYTLANRKNSVLKQYSEIGALVAYLKSFLPSVGLSAESIAIGGYSAGGHLSTWYAYASEGYSPIKIAFLLDIVGPVNIANEGYQLAFENIRATQATKVGLFSSMLCGMLGVSSEGVNIATDDMTDIWNAAAKLSGVPYVTSNSCPTIMVYAGGTFDEEGNPEIGSIFATQNDTLVPLSCYTELKTKLDDFGVTNVSRVFNGETHMTLSNSAEACAWLSARAEEYAEAYMN